jgi:anaerobic magnesium-protoporphyrin IX monomethyl ester cyclase
MVRRAMPDDVGVSVSYPLPGTSFHRMMEGELEDKTNWKDSGDLAMMFKGSYHTPFYRKMHDILHHELRLKKLMAERLGQDDEELFREVDHLSEHWFELGQLEAEDQKGD